MLRVMRAPQLNRRKISDTVFRSLNSLLNDFDIVSLIERTDSVVIPGNKLGD